MYNFSSIIRGLNLSKSNRKERKADQLYLKRLKELEYKQYVNNVSIVKINKEIESCSNYNKKSEEYQILCELYAKLTVEQKELMIKVDILCGGV